MALEGSKTDAGVASGRVWTFAGREFDESRLELRVHGELVELELKPLEILLQLLLRAGEVVTKDELLDAVWPMLEVVEGSLTTAVYKLRHALQDHDSSIIVTVPRVGYRLSAAVQSQPSRPPVFPVDISLTAGSAVPGRENWRLSHSLESSPNGEVWLAENPKTHELRVFKFASSPSRFKSLRREVTVFRFLRETLGQLPEFVRIFEWNFEKPPYYVESEYGGPDLVEWAESHGGLSNIPLETRLGVFASIAEAVARSHRAGVLHKDLKPANVLVTAGEDGRIQIRIVDFGSASLIEPDRLAALGITNLGFTQTVGAAAPHLTGTLMYMAPEQFCGQSPSASTDVYALGVMLYQLVVGNFHKPLAQGWEIGVEDPLLREDITRAVHGDPAQRLRDPAELANLIRTLDTRRKERQELEEKKRREQARERRRSAARAWRPWIASAALVLLVFAASIYLLRKASVTGPAQPDPLVQSVAVLPFQNIQGDPSVDFLHLALPDEVATALSYSRGISVRPFGDTEKYNGPGLDPQKAGQELRVKSIITGRFVKADKQLEVTLEAIDVGSDRLTWQDTLVAPLGDLLELRRQISVTIQEGLAPALGSQQATQGAAMRPQNAQAYELYLHSIALANDGDPNRKGISMLQKAVTLDPGYAPAWRALGMRYYYAYQYGGGGREMLERSEGAEERAVKLEPNFMAAGTMLVVIRAERGHLAEAFEQARKLVQQRPDSAYAHFMLAYVYRYAGLMKEAAQQAEKAWALDPHNPHWRSNESIFEQLGDFQRAMDFLNLADPHSQWARAHLVQLLVREGRPKKAMKVKPAKIPGWESFTMLQDCAGHRPANEIAALAKAVRPNIDPEMNYSFAAHLAYCGQTDAAFHLLKLSIEGNHCSYPEMNTDPLLANLRSNPQFAYISAAGKACQARFLAETKPIPTTAAVSSVPLK